MSYQGGYPPQQNYNDIPPTYGPPQPTPPGSRPGTGPPAAAPPPPQGGPPPAEGGAKKKRAYAAQAYDFGTGGNVVQQPPMPGEQWPGPGAAAAAGGYGYQGGQPQQPYGAPYGTQPHAQAQAPIPQPSYPAPGQGVGGYVPPAPAYPAAGHDQTGIAPQFGQMGLNNAPPHTGGGGGGLNVLQPTDLIQKPFLATDLDVPAPAVLVPPGSSVTQAPTANVPARYMASTLNAVPATYNVLKKSKLPFALIIQPYGALHDAEDPIPLIQDQIICRCRRCRSYINPFVTFIDQGHRWRCNMCNLSNDVPSAFDYDSATQQAVDRWQRPELNHGIVEFVAPQEYMVRPPQPLAYLFLLDVSYAAVTSGLLATTARTILESLDRIPNADRRTRLGFMAVDTSLHYFSIPTDESPNKDATMLVVSDLDEPFLPTPTDLLVPLSNSRESIELFLGKLQDMFQATQTQGSAMGAALRAGHKLISGIGGKIVVLTASLPSLGPGKLEMREDKKLLGTGKEGALLQTGNSFYKSFAVECSKNQVSVDMFLFSSQYQDVASLSNLPRYTGGQTYFYPGWNAGRDEDAMKFAREFSDHLSSEIALEAVMRIRATTGLRMNTFYGNFFNRSSDLCAFPAFPRDQGYVVEVAIDENVQKPIVCMQTAVLHTTCNGERRIRVMTLALPTTQTLVDVFASADATAIATYYSHKAVERTLSSGLDSARDMLQAKIVELCQTYRKELAGGNVSGGVQFPSNLRPLPVLFLALMKNVGLKKSTQIPTDLRSAALCLLSTLPRPLLIQFIYPTFYSLHDIPDSVGLPDPTTGEIVMPQRLNLSSERIVSHGLYLIDDGQTQFLWVGRDAVPQLVTDVFGLPDVTHLKVGKGKLPLLDNEFNERIRLIIEKSRDHHSQGVGSIIVPHLYIVREDGEPSLKIWAQTMLVEDRADQGLGLMQWMGTLREKVNQ